MWWSSSNWSIMLLWPGGSMWRAMRGETHRLSIKPKWKRLCLLAVINYILIVHQNQNHVRLLLNLQVENIPDISEKNLQTNWRTLFFMHRHLYLAGFDLDSETFRVLWLEHSSKEGIDYDEFVTLLTKLQILRGNSNSSMFTCGYCFYKYECSSHNLSRLIFMMNYNNNITFVDHL